MYLFKQFATLLLTLLTIFFMKTSSIIKSTILIATFLHSFSFAQNLKTYSGPFEDGNATYTYYNDEYGNKVLQGNFTFTESIKVERASVTVKINGSFLKGKRNGKWSFESVGKGSYTKNILGTDTEYRMNVSQSVIVSYLNGVLHGDFSIRALQSDYIPDLGQYGYVNSDITYQMRFSNGVLDGKFLIVDKDKNEPENLTGFVKQGFYEGLFTDNGKEIVYQDGVLIKNQNWDKADQDELKAMVNSYLMVKDQGEQGLMEVDLHLDRYCESYPTTLIDKYISKFYGNSDWLHEEIPGDDGYESSGCYYVIISDKDKADFTKSAAWETLEKYRSEGSTFEYIIKYNELESSFSQYKLSSIKTVKSQYQLMLDKLDEALNAQIQFKKTLDSLTQDFNSFKTKEYKKAVIDYAELLDAAKSSGRISSYYSVINDRQKIYFTIEKNLGIFLPARKFASMYVNEIQTLINKHNFTSFKNPKSGERMEVTLSASRNSVFEAQQNLNELKMNGLQLIQLEDQVINELVKLNAESKKASFERLLSEKLLLQFDQIVIQVYQGNMNDTTYMNELEKIKASLDLAIGFKDIALKIENEKVALEQEAKGARNSIEQAIYAQVLNDFIQKIESLQNELKNIQNLNDSQLNTSIASAKDYFEKLTVQRQTAKGLQQTIDAFISANTKLSTIEFEDKNISKFVNEINELKVEAIKATFIDNKSLNTSETNKLSENCINEINLYLQMATSFQNLQSIKLSKEQVKEFNSLKKDPVMLCEKLLKLNP
jgi:hypothetical protein